MPYSTATCTLIESVTFFTCY